MTFPRTRLRRLRRTAHLRRMARETLLSTDDFVYPLFVCPGEGVDTAIREALERGTTFGAPTAAEVKLAELICSALPAMDMVRLVNSGTEATMSALRLARAATSRTRFIKLAGCYHGHADAFLVAAGSGAATLGVPSASTCHRRPTRPSSSRPPTARPP